MEAQRPMGNGCHRNTRQAYREAMTVEAGFARRRPRALYGRPELLAEMWKAYEETGAVRYQVPRQYQDLRQAMQVISLAWFWNAAGVVHPRAEELIAGLMGFLQATQEG